MVYLIEGRHEARARAELARQWLQTLHTPKRKRTVFDTSGYRRLLEQPALFNTVMIDIRVTTNRGTRAYRKGQCVTCRRCKRQVLAWLKDHPDVPVTVAQTKVAGMRTSA